MNDDTPAETGWLYRRWYSFSGVVVIYLLLLVIILSLGASPDPLKWIALALIGWGAIKDGLYMAGASIIEYAKLAGAWKGNKVDDILVATTNKSTTESNSTSTAVVRNSGSAGNGE